MRRITVTRYGKLIRYSSSQESDVLSRVLIKRVYNDEELTAALQGIIAMGVRYLTINLQWSTIGQIWITVSIDLVMLLRKLLCASSSKGAVERR